MSQLQYFLAFSKIARLGPRTVLKLLQKWPDLSELFSLKQTQLEAAGLHPELACAISTFNLKSIEADLKWVQESKNHHILCLDSEHYPALLKEIHDPPTVLYAKGSLCALAQPSVAVVGSRNPSIAGKENAWAFSKALAMHQISVVSGLALGIDTQAHHGTLAAKGRTVAVLGTGINRVYPLRNQALAEQITENGLLLSEFSLNTAAIAGHFPRRNRIISGLTLCTLVVEAAVRSGSLITARLALEQNRGVLAIPGSIHNPLARGCHLLLQEGAKLVGSIDDILDELGIQGQEKSMRNAYIPLARERKNLVECIGFETTSVDQIVTRSERPVTEVSTTLAQLELDGIIRAVPGGYIRVSL